MYFYLFIFFHVFFPICCVDHFFLICFDLKKRKVVIIDNSSIDEEIESRYCSVPELLVRNNLNTYSYILLLFLFLFYHLLFFIIIAD
jgi:hypothetical protein